MSRKNPFERFYDYELSIVKLSKGGGYSDRGKENTEELCKIIADVQPYNGGLASNDYGLDIECQYRIFTDRNPYLTEGNYVVIDGQKYRIVYTANWKFGAIAILSLSGDKI